MIKKVNRFAKQHFDLDNLLWIWGPIVFTAFWVALCAVTLIFLVIADPLLGLYPFGPKKTETITVERLYVDANGKSSSYMVGTDKGVFEMDNSIWLGIYNIDELYSKLQAGKSFKVTTKGNKLTTWYCNEYPHIISID